MADLTLVHSQTPAGNLDVIDQLSMKLAQLEAMLCLTYGASREGFESMAENHRDNFMWACSTMVDECKDLCEKLPVVSGRSVAEGR